MDTETRVTAMSSLACDLCKKKKSRCDRQMPSCSFCRRTANGCTYPTARLKPGPKLGSTHRRRIVRPSTSKERDVRASLSSISPGATGAAGPTQLEKPDLERRSISGVCESSSPPQDDSPSSTSIHSTRSSQMVSINVAKAISLSSFLHPSHEASFKPTMNPRARTQPGFLLVIAGAQEKLTKACDVLRMSIHQAQSMIDIFFEMVAGLQSMSLFHQPTFPDKIRAIEDTDLLICLFASMFSLSARFSKNENYANGNRSGLLSHQELHSLALQYIHTVLESCLSTQPPLCLLQAITLAGYYKLVNGVDGPAWRLVGTGVRIAYELRLHLIDRKETNIIPACESELLTWSSNEERRRCWWALWEMDIFASTIQRAPTAIDWSMNETYLPVSDEYWFRNKYQPSCSLQGGPEERSRTLRRSRNDYSVAWALLFATFMHDGQLLCQKNMQGMLSNLNSTSDVPRLPQYLSHGHKRKSDECADLLCSLVRAYEDATENLPAVLAYKGEVLPFSLVEGEDRFFARRTCAGKYNVHMMSASARFMIYQNYVFADIIEGVILFSSFDADSELWEQGPVSKKDPTTLTGLQNYLKASDMVLQLLANCPEDHVQYVNPYYASTTWIAAALQIFKKIALRDPISTVTQRQYAVLRQSYRRFSQFWNTPLALLQNLDSLETRLEARQKELEASEGTVRSIDTEDQRLQGQMAHAWDKETITSSEYQQQQSSCSHSSLHGPSDEPFQPYSGEPNVNYPALLAGKDVECLAPMNSEVDLSAIEVEFPDQFTNGWPNELFMDNLAWYSSDLMAGLCHGYTA